MINHNTLIKIIIAYILLLAMLLGPKILAKDFDIYINDDGKTCNVMIDFHSFRDKLGKTEIKRERFVRKYLVNATQDIEQEDCSFESSLLLSAIFITKRDSYGQPHWGSVKYIYEYNSDLRKIKDLEAKDITDEILATLLVRVK